MRTDNNFWKKSQLKLLITLWRGIWAKKGIDG